MMDEGSRAASERQNRDAQNRDAQNRDAKNRDAKNRMLRYVCAAALLTTAGCRESENAAGGFAMPPTAVEVAVVGSQVVEDRFEAVGNVEADRAVEIVSEIAGSIVELPFREGGYVEAGALIARIDDAQLAAELSRAEALLAQRQSAFNRVREVVELGAGARQDLDDASASLKVAQADVELAKARLDKSRIRAPFGGLVGARKVSPGAFVRVGEAIVDLARISEVRVTFAVPERYLSSISRGARVEVTTPAYPELRRSGSIIVVEPILDEGTRTTRVVASVENRDGFLRPGMSANVAAILDSRGEALTIPAEAVFVDGAQPFVFVVGTDSTVHRTPVTLGTRLSDVVEVVGGIERGSMVVRAGHQKLFEGALVLPVQSQDAPAASPVGAPAASPSGSPDDAQSDGGRP